MTKFISGLFNILLLLFLLKEINAFLERKRAVIRSRRIKNIFTCKAEKGRILELIRLFYNLGFTREHESGKEN